MAVKLYIGWSYKDVVVIDKHSTPLDYIAVKGAMNAFICSDWYENSEEIEKRFEKYKEKEWTQRIVNGRIIYE